MAMSVSQLLSRENTVSDKLSGRRYPAIEFLVSSEHIESFCQAIGDTSFATEKGTAKAAPPSFLACLREGEFNVFRDLQLELKQLLHGSQSYEFFQPIFADDKIHTTTSIKRVELKQTRLGDKVLLVIETEFDRVSSSPPERVARSESLILIGDIQ